MALVIDGSSPAVSTTAAQTNTCASFTPPDSPLLLGLWAGDSVGNVDPLVAPSASSSPAQTWSTYAWDHRSSGSSPALDGQTALFAALVTGTPGATTVSVVDGVIVSPSYGSAMQVLVLTGHDPVAPIGATGSGRANTASSITGTYTGTIDGGQGFMAVSDWDATSSTPWAAGSGCTMIAKGTIGGEISYAILRRTDSDGVSGGSTSLSMTGLGGVGSFHYSYFEVISQTARDAQLLAALAAGVDVATSQTVGTSPLILGG